MNNLQSFNLQWHITDKCNLRCTHCYQESYNGRELSLSQLVGVVDQFKDFLTDKGLQRRVVKETGLCGLLQQFFSPSKVGAVPGHITLTGGEPLVRKDLYELLSVFKENKDYFGFSLLTNGTLINAENAARIKEYGPRYVQVSIEGNRETHDAIRGNGMYDKAVQGLTHLVDQDIYTLISFTAHRQNYHEFPAVAKLGRELGVSRVWSDRLIPNGSGEKMKEMMFTPEDTRAFFQIMKEEQLKRSPDYYPKTEVAMHRALQFLCGGSNYSCQAGKALLTIDTNGDVYPCRRMPIKVGNVLEEHLSTIYDTNPVLQELREEQSSCSSCVYYKRCQGGLRCLSYAVTGNALEKDPGCWIKS